MANFGFGSHQGHDEVFVGPYKMFEIYADTPEKYRLVLQDLGLKQQDPLKTVWENFRQDAPRRRNRIDGKPSIWDMLDELKKRGFYTLFS